MPEQHIAFFIAPLLIVRGAAAHRPALRAQRPVIEHHQYEHGIHHLPDGLNCQKRHPQAIHINLDEMICSTQGAHVALLNLETLSQEEVAEIRRDYGCLAELAREYLVQGGSDTDEPEIEDVRAK